MGVLSEKKIFEYHLGGKICLGLTKRLADQRDLSLAYTPGVSKVCEEIQRDGERAYSLTAKGNLVAVVTDGTAVLGLGNIGALASIPVMEGKAVLFRNFAGVDAWPVPIEGALNADGRTDVEKFIERTAAISCMYGGINLEDIAAPACFEIEDRLDAMLDIPVFHDDQWGTAIITVAALKNYCIISKKKAAELSVVINGAGAAGLRIADMIKALGVTDCVICDSKGVLSSGRKDLNPHKKRHAANTGKRTLSEAMKGADVFIGVSVADCVSPDMILSMGEYPAIFAMANPDPEIRPETVKAHMKDRKYIMATGRSDYPNQVNNVLGFPFIFRGALDVRASSITMGMKISAAEALADLAREGDVPESVKKAYNRDFEFGPDYLIPTPFDPRIKKWESLAVAKAAIEDGVAAIKKLPVYQ
ncbi:MAG: malic enzyme-like NAD(P)-binding protein [Candidatus Omnitrophota bacterium]|nr:malate dehydrogenase [Candidatus Omnitrophota bacterium]